MKTDDDLFDDGRHPLALTPDEVARLTRPEREARVRALVEDARDIFARGIEAEVLADGREVAAVIILFSGGSDSTVLAHLFKGDADYAAHANTTVGIEETRDFVRRTCAAWGLPLLERLPPREVDRYRHLVLTDQRGKNGQALGGFPGPALHFKMFARLKGRAIEAIQRELVDNPRRRRVVFVAGRRRTESKRRANVPEHERKGSAVWVSPLVRWTKLDLNTYRVAAAAAGDSVPVNQVSELIHMSGECLCGAMASPGERAESAAWYPGAFEQIAELEALLAERDDIPEHRKVWGWGADPVLKAAEDAYLARFNATPEHDDREGAIPNMCTACDDRFDFDFGFDA